MAKRKKKPINCESCFYSKKHSEENMWCMLAPTHKLVFKTHWCGGYMSIQIAADMNLEKPDD